MIILGSLKTIGVVVRSRLANTIFTYKLTALIDYGWSVDLALDVEHCCAIGQKLNK